MSPKSNWRASREKWKENYRRDRAALVKRLGGQCALCAETENLQFDHTEGRDWKLHRVNAFTRLRIYELEASNGLLRLLCISCNSKYKP